MRPLSLRAYSNDVLFVPKVQSEVTAEGTVRDTWPADEGVAMKASVQANPPDRTEPDGAVTEVTGFDVLTRTDPHAREGDQFRWNDKVLSVQGPAVDEGGRGVAWTTRCIETIQG